MLFMHGYRRPVPVLSLFCSCWREEACTCTGTYLRTSTHKVFIQPHFLCLVTLPRSKGEKIPKMTVSIQQRKAVCFLWLCIIQIQNDSFLLSEDKLKKLAHFPLVQLQCPHQPKQAKHSCLKKSYSRQHSLTTKDLSVKRISPRHLVVRYLTIWDKIDSEESWFF